MAEKVLQKIHGIRLESRGRPINLCASLGVSSTELFAPSTPTAKALTVAADEALYRAKTAGRDQVICDVAKSVCERRRDFGAL